jgi:hypothetical protein
MRSWLDELGTAYPHVPSRFPTGSEIRAALSEIEGYRVEISAGGIGAPWQASVSRAIAPEQGPWTVLNITAYSGDDMPQEVWFAKGWQELIEQIVGRFALRCGPLTVFPDTGEEPKVIDGAT